MRDRVNEAWQQDVEPHIFRDGDREGAFRLNYLFGERRFGSEKAAAVSEARS